MNTAKSICPVRTGRLRKSINVKVQDLTIEVSANTPYAGFVEFGTRNMPAQPFIRPSLKLREYLDKIQKSIIKEIDKCFE